MGKMALGKKNAVLGAPRWFSESRRLYAVKPVLLADIGEGEILVYSTRPEESG